MSRLGLKESQNELGHYNYGHQFGLGAVCSQFCLSSYVCLTNALCFDFGYLLRRSSASRIWSRMVILIGATLGLLGSIHDSRVIIQLGDGSN